MDLKYEQEQSTEDKISRLLEDFLHLADEELSSVASNRLIEDYAYPVITGILTNKFRSHANSHDKSVWQNFEDIQNDSVRDVIEQLNRYKENPSKYPITDFRGLVATITDRAHANFFRKRSPRRYSLVGRLRYSLKNTKDLAVWKDDEVMLCGNEAWQHRPSKATDWQQHDLLQTVANTAAAKYGENDLKSLLTMIFKGIASPVPLDDLAAAVARALGISDLPTVVDEEEFLPHAKTPDPILTIDSQTQVQKLWKEILELPPNQRKALLFNFNDGKESALALITDHTSNEEIASLLEMTPEEFTAIWNSLPWEDSRIADNLGLTRQQVINLRKSARKRLQRRLKDSLY